MKLKDYSLQELQDEIKRRAVERRKDTPREGNVKNLNGTRFTKGQHYNQ